MLVGKEIYSKIDEIVDRAYLGFMFMLLGDDFFTTEQKRQVEALGLLVGTKPLIELLYIIVRQRSTPGYAKDRTLQELLDQVALSGVLPIINDTNQYSVDHAKVQMFEAIEDTKRELKKRVKREVLKTNEEFKNDLAVERITSVPDVQSKKELKADTLVAGIGLLTAAIQSNFVRSFTTSLTNFVNATAVDEVTTDRLVEGRREEVEVFKTVVNDGHLCDWCRKFYVKRDGSPRIFKLTELKANGSNEGKPRSQWRPVIGSTHPFCRCQLQYLRRPTP